MNSASFVNPRFTFDLFMACLNLFPYIWFMHSSHRREMYLKYGRTMKFTSDMSCDVKDILYVIRR